MIAVHSKEIGKPAKCEDGAAWRAWLRDSETAVYALQKLQLANQNADTERTDVAHACHVEDDAMRAGPYSALDGVAQVVCPGRIQPACETKLKRLTFRMLRNLHRLALRCDLPLEIWRGSAFTKRLIGTAKKQLCRWGWRKVSNKIQLGGTSAKMCRVLDEWIRIAVRTWLRYLLAWRAIKAGSFVVSGCT